MSAGGGALQVYSLIMSPQMGYEWQPVREPRAWRRQTWRGFWLRARRFSISMLCVRWKFSYGQAVKLLKRGKSITRNQYHNLKRKKIKMVSTADSSSSSSRSSSSSSSFYSDAISDCLEYIKMTSTSADD